MARLQRNDLAKEFEEIVKQEIKNHNDSILQTNISINSLKEQVNSLQKDLQNCRSESKNLCDNKQVGIDILAENIKKSISHINSKINDYRESQNRELANVKESISSRESYFLMHKDFEQFHVKVDEWIAQTRRLFEVHNSTLAQSISKASEAHKPTCQEMEDRLVKMMFLHEKDFKMVKESLDIFALNFEGLKREITLLKKQNFIVEKNIENIYTQLDRVKGKE